MAMHTDDRHRHGHHAHTDAEGQQHAPQEYDAEISLKGVYLTIGGILGITLVAMVAMWFLSLTLIAVGESGDRELMPVEAAQRARTLQLENRLQGGVVLDRDDLESDYDRRSRMLGGAVPPGLDETWPSDIELPPAPRVQYAPMNDWLIMRDDQTRALMAPEDPADTSRVSIEEAMEYVLSEGLVRGGARREESPVGAPSDAPIAADTEDAAAPTGTQGDGGTPPAAGSETDGTGDDAPDAGSSADRMPSDATSTDASAESDESDESEEGAR